MYVVTSTGKKLPVDDSSIDYEDYFPFQQNVGLYDDSTVLKPIWHVAGQRMKRRGSFMTDSEYEFVAEKVYDHKPSKEELLWFMSANGLNRYDIVAITEGYELDMEWD